MKTELEDDMKKDGRRDREREEREQALLLFV